MQLKAFIKDRLISCKISINSKIALNHFILPKDKKSKKPHGQTAGKCLTTQFLTKWRDAVRHRREKAEILFSTEIFGISQCLSINGHNIYHGTKSNIQQRFKPTEFLGNETSSAVIIELSAILRCSFNAIIFNDFAGKIYAYIIDIATGYDRVDIVCDRYFENSLKSLTRHDREFGVFINFDGNSEFLTGFKDNFIKNPKTKENLNSFLAKKFLEIHNTGIIIVITIENGILTNDTTLRTDPVISSCSAEEADQKLVRHMLQCLMSGIKTIVVKTVDTDVFLLLLAYRHSGGGTFLQKCLYG